MSENNDLPPSPSIEDDHWKQPMENSRQIIKAIFDTTNSTIIFLSPDYKIIFFNKKANDGTALLYGRGLAVGESILDFRFEGDDEINKSFKENFEKALANGCTVVSEKKMHYPSSAFWVCLEYTPVFEQDKIIGIAVCVKEINERKRFEQHIQKQNDKLKQIAWMQSHETRQPVATILGLINILDKASLTPENKEIIKLLEKTIEQLDNVIRNTVIQATAKDTDTLF